MVDGGMQQVLTIFYTSEDKDVDDHDWFPVDQAPGSILLIIEEATLEAILKCIPGYKTYTITDA